MEIISELNINENVMKLSKVLLVQLASLMCIIWSKKYEKYRQYVILMILKLENSS